MTQEARVAPVVIPSIHRMRLLCNPPEIACVCCADTACVCCITRQVLPPLQQHGFLVQGGLPDLPPPSPIVVLPGSNHLACIARIPSVATAHKLQLTKVFGGWGPSRSNTNSKGVVGGSVPTPQPTSPIRSWHADRSACYTVCSNSMNNEVVRNTFLFPRKHM